MIQGHALKPSETVEREYRKELRILVLAMHKATVRALEQSVGLSDESIALDAENPSFAKFQAKTKDLEEKFNKILERMGRIAAQRFLEESIKYASRSFIRSVKPLIEGKNASLMINAPTITEANRAFIEQKVAENVGLIKTIGKRYFARIEAEQIKVMSGGGDMGSMKRFLMELNGKNERQAKLIARDQASKIYSQLSVENMKRAGITKVKWVHSSAGKVPREYHKTRWDGHSDPPNGLNGYIFDVNSPPVADKKTGERAIPGQLINCRCFSIPVIDV